MAKTPLVLLCHAIELLVQTQSLLGTLVALREKVGY